MADFVEKKNSALTLNISLENSQGTVLDDLEIPVLGGEAAATDANVSACLTAITGAGSSVLKGNPTNIIKATLSQNILREKDVTPGN